MDPVANAVLGIVFLALGAAGTFLMYHLWGYPFDHETHTSEAPPRLMRIHRLIGWLYLILYLYFMSQMVPRLWNYQIEFPARTVAHLTLGMTIGALIVIKIAIVRFFKHMESTLVPLLGTALLVCTILLIGLSAPFAFREAYLRAQQTGGSFSDETLERVRSHLVLAGLDDPETLAHLASPTGLEAGQGVLLAECVTCHDLRTVLARPRTPENWHQTVQRMADRSTLLAPIDEDQQWEVTAYLIAISPELQRSARERKKRLDQEEASQRAATQVAGMAEQGAGQAVQGPGTQAAGPGTRGAGEAAPAPVDPEQARQLYETRCALCHPLTVVEAAPPTSDAETRALVSRMVSNGMPATEEELVQLIDHLNRAFVNR